MTSPTQRTLAYCRSQGWVPDVVERWIQGAKIRRDLFGGIDLVVLDGEPGALGIQATAASCMGSRVEKLTGLPEMAHWLRSGLRLEVWGWRQLRSSDRLRDGSRSKRRVWAPRRMRARLDEDGGLEWDDVP